MNRYFLIALMSGALLVGCKSTHKSGSKSAGLSYAQQVEFNEIFFKATNEKLQGNTTKAIDLYKQCLKMDDQNADVWYELARLELSRGHFSDAINTAAIAVKLNPNEYWYNHLFGTLLLKTPDEKNLETVYARLIAMKPGNTHLYYDMISYYDGKRDWQKSLTWLDKLEAITGPTINTVTARKDYLLRSKQREKGLELVKSYADKYPNDLDYQLVYFETMVELGKSAELLQKLPALEKKFPNSGELSMLEADIYLSVGDSIRAGNALKTAFSDPQIEVERKTDILVERFLNNPSNTPLILEELGKIIVETHEGDPNAYSIYGDILKSRGKNKEARSNFIKAADMNGNSQKFALWQQILNCDLALNTYDSVIVDADRALELFPTQSVFYLFKGIAQLQQKSYANSISSFKSGLDLVTENPKMEVEFCSNLGEAYNAMKQYSKSDEYFEKALKIDPQNFSILNNYAYYLSLRGANLSRAEELAQRVVDANPTNSTFLDTYAWVLFMEGKYTEALAAQQKAISYTQSPSATLVEHLGDIFAKLGKMNEAVSNWEKAIQLGGNEQYIRKKIKAGKYVEE